ncbi:MAG: sialate O-acetylesterase [Acidobacteria bacterium]|nr:sialate O-acetylesterase [Acidobacteriota bacterium]
MRLVKSILLSLLFASCLTASVLAAVKPHALFSDGCVLQQGMPVPVWGWADEGETVTVEFQGQKVTAITGGGKWMVTLKELKAGGPFEMKLSGSDTVTIKNILVGEVWLCSGQSNMEWRLNQTVNAKADIVAANYPKIHLFTVPRNPQDAPVDNVKGEWKECSPESVPTFSAVGYFFGRALHLARQGVPIGLIHSSYGGTPSEAWTSASVVNNDPHFAGIRESYAKAVAAWPENKAKWEAAVEKHKEVAAKAKEEGKTAPPTPAKPFGPEHQNRPAGLYNGMIAPLIPFALRGAIWYQGESNAPRAFEYRSIFPAMIQDWRTAWKSEFPFLFVQLAPYAPPPPNTYAELREAQLLTLKLPKTGMAVITDVGEERDIHPKQKQPVGERLALAARAIAYGEKIEYSGPVYSAMKVKGNSVELSFHHVGGGLVVKGDKLTGFAIAGADQKFVSAEAIIKGDKIIVSSSTVAQPVAVRFGWENWPVLNLWNKAGLPATPFRTDDFPMVTAPKP